VQRVALDIDLGDAACLRVGHELGVGHVVGNRRPAVELLENSEQHQGDHHPDRYLGKRVVQSQPPRNCDTRAKGSFYPNALIVFTKTLKLRTQFLRPRATRNVSDDLSRDALGLRSTTRTKCRLKRSTICENPLP